MCDLLTLPFPPGAEAAAPPDADRCALPAPGHGEGVDRPDAARAQEADSHRHSQVLPVGLLGGRGQRATWSAPGPCRNPEGV